MRNYSFSRYYDLHYAILPNVPEFMEIDGTVDNPQTHFENAPSLANFHALFNQQMDFPLENDFNHENNPLLHPNKISDSNNPCPLPAIKGALKI